MCPSNMEIHTLSMKCDNKMLDADTIFGFQREISRKPVLDQWRATHARGHCLGYR